MLFHTYQQYRFGQRVRWVEESTYPDYRLVLAEAYYLRIGTIAPTRRIAARMAVAWPS